MRLDVVFHVYVFVVVHPLKRKVFWDSLSTSTRAAAWYTGFILKEAMVTTVTTVNKKVTISHWCLRRMMR